MKSWGNVWDVRVSGSRLQDVTWALTFFSWALKYRSLHITSGVPGGEQSTWECRKPRNVLTSVCKDAFRFAESK